MGKTVAEMQEQKASKEQIEAAIEKVNDAMALDLSELDSLALLLGLAAHVAVKMKHQAIKEGLETPMRQFLTQTFQFIWDTVVRG